MTADLIRKFFGLDRPHDEAREVSEAVNALQEDVKELSGFLKPYVEADDPLVALMTDMFNQRSMRDRDVGSE